MRARAKICAVAAMVIAILALQPATATSDTTSPLPSPLVTPSAVATLSPTPEPSRVPAPSWSLPAGTSDVELPAQFYNGVVVVRMSVASGRGIDLTLDTGAGQDFLDTSVVSGLSDATAGSAFTLPDARFGDATLHNIRFTSGPFLRRYDKDTEVVGILGYDFFKSAVVKIDYEHRSIHVISPEAFTVPGGAAVLAIDPVSRIPIVQATIGSASGTSFIVDSGAATVVVFPRLAKANPDAFTAKQELKDDSQTIYYRLFWPLCGEIQQNPYSVSQVALGKLGVRDWVVWKPDEKSCFSPEGIDGLIGYDFLRLFNVYVDYPDHRVVLEPNTLYQSATNTIKP